MIWALISPTFSSIRTSTGRWPSRIYCGISGTHFGQSESVERGQPSGGFDFSHDLSSGLSDHFGVGETFGLTRFNRSNTAHAPVAATVTAFSTYLIGLCILLSLSSAWECRHFLMSLVCSGTSSKFQHSPFSGTPSIHSSHR